MKSSVLKSLSLVAVLVTAVTHPAQASLLPMSQNPQSPLTEPVLAGDEDFYSPYCQCTLEIGYYIPGTTYSFTQHKDLGFMLFEECRKLGKRYTVDQMAGRYLVQTHTICEDVGIIVTVPDPHSEKH